ncbi:unnamed protein product [Hymenolepis diminuta]|uniref:Uncharacterized protein n=1 Tax=Hymenolepis diminuta TaxID=6216 RepID=A0A564Y8J9_HYMDI|nr:unnamed protein product [Hymenolepis diminuta]
MLSWLNSPFYLLPTSTVIASHCFLVLIQQQTLESKTTSYLRGISGIPATDSTFESSDHLLILADKRDSLAVSSDKPENGTFFYDLHTFMTYILNEFNVLNNLP